MTTLTWPSTLPRPAGLTFSLKPNTQVFQSPLTQSTQTLEIPGARWVASITWTELVQSEIRTLRAFLARLRGRSGRLYLWDMSLETPAGIATGTPLVNGAAQTGSTLTTDGWTISQTGILKAGDYIGVNGELKVITADANSNASGQATLTFEPPLRASPADNAAITVSAPKCTFRLADDDQDTIPIQAPLRGSITLNFEEVFA